MADSDKKVEYEVDANPAGFTAAMEKAKADAAAAAQQIRASFESVEATMNSLSGALSTVTGLIGKMTMLAAGGAAFKEIIGASNDWTGEAKKLSVQLGITTERASVMMVAMRHLGLDAELVTLAAGKMSKQIATNGAAFEELGVKVKDSSGQYRAPLEIMGELNTKLKEIKNPIEQNIAGTAVYGKSWNDIKATLKLTTEEMKAAEQKTKDLGLVVGDEGAANAKKYKESMNDLKLVMTSLEVQAGAAVLPTFVRLGSWFSSAGPVAGKAMSLVLESLLDILSMVGEVVQDVWGIISTGFTAIGEVIGDVMGTKAPTAMEFFINVLKVVELAFLGLQVAVRLVIDFIMGVLEVWVAHTIRMAAAAERAMHLDFAGAKKAWAGGAAEIEEIERKHFDSMAKIATDGKAKMDAIINREPAKGAEVKDKQTPADGPTYDFSKDKAEKAIKSRIHEWEAKLDADKDGYVREQAIAGTAIEYSHTMEAAYWKKVLDTATLSTEEKAQVSKKYYASLAAIRKEDFDNEIAGQKLTMETYKNNHIARMEIANQLYEANVARFGAESKEAKAALADVYKEQRAFSDQSIAQSKAEGEAKRNAELAGIDAAQQDAEQQLSLRQISQAKMLEMSEQFEAKRYQIKMQAMLAQQALMRGSDEDPVALAQIQGQIEAMEQQHQLKMSAIKNKATLEQNKNTTEMYGSIQSGMQRVLAGTANGTLKISGLLQNMMQVVTSSVIDMVTQSAAQWLMNMLLGEAESKVTAISQISANAGVAGAAATASAAAIPLYGWAIAPEAGAAASAAAMAYMPMASARNGFDIPAGLNPVTQLHEKEMVLPQKQADAVRDMADGGGNAPMQVHIHAMDGQSVERMLKRNGAAVQAALQNQLRNYSK